MTATKIIDEELLERAILCAPIQYQESLKSLNESDKSKLVDKYIEQIKPKEDLLRKLRGHLAYSKQVKPYVIFKDKELFDILRVKPKTLDELSRIKGFPRQGARVTKWGEAIIAIFNIPKKIEDFEVTIGEDGEAEVKVVMNKMEMF